MDGPWIYIGLTIAAIVIVAAVVLAWGITRRTDEDDEES